MHPVLALTRENGTRGKTGKQERVEAKTGLNCDTARSKMAVAKTVEAHDAGCVRVSSKGPTDAWNRTSLEAAALTVRREERLL